MQISGTAAAGGRLPGDLERRRIERALRDRRRYRYVSPSVTVVGDGFLIRSPCCSRNIDPEGGVIDIALIRMSGADSAWLLYRKDHGAQRWVLHQRHARLVDLLAQLNADPERRFWQ